MMFQGEIRSIETLLEASLAAPAPALDTTVGVRHRQRSRLP